MNDQVVIVGREEYTDWFMYELVDKAHRRHTVQIPSLILQIEPKGFDRASDRQHLDTVAIGAVLMRADPEATFHRVDKEMVERAYEASSRQIS